MSSTCTICQGSGEQSFDEIHFKEGEKVIVKNTIPCIWCEGTGTMTERQRKLRLDFEGVWCRCGERGGDDERAVLFCDDNEGKRETCVAKHHYHCSWCDRLIQIG